MKTGDDSVNLNEHRLYISTDVEEIRRTVRVVNAIHNGNCLCLTPETDISMYESLFVSRKCGTRLQQWNPSESNGHLTIGLQTTLQASKETYNYRRCRAITISLCTIAETSTKNFYP